MQPNALEWIKYIDANERIPQELITTLVECDTSVISYFVFRMITNVAKGVDIIWGALCSEDALYKLVKADVPSVYLFQAYLNGVIDKSEIQSTLIISDGKLLNAPELAEVDMQLVATFYDKEQLDEQIATDWASIRQFRKKKLYYDPTTRLSVALSNDDWAEIKNLFDTNVFTLSDTELLAIMSVQQGAASVLENLMIYTTGRRDLANVDYLCQIAVSLGRLAIYEIILRLATVEVSFLNHALAAISSFAPESLTYILDNKIDPAPKMIDHALECHNSAAVEILLRRGQQITLTNAVYYVNHPAVLQFILNLEEVPELLTIAIFLDGDDNSRDRVLEKFGERLHWNAVMYGNLQSASFRPELIKSCDFQRPNRFSLKSHNAVSFILSNHLAFIHPDDTFVVSTEDLRRGLENIHRRPCSTLLHFLHPLSYEKLKLIQESSYVMMLPDQAETIFVEIAETVKRSAFKYTYFESLRFIIQYITTHYYPLGQEMCTSLLNSISLNEINTRLRPTAELWLSYGQNQLDSTAKSFKRRISKTISSGQFALIGIFLAKYVYRTFICK